MSTVPTQIRIDAEVKEQANLLFEDLGLDMSGAVNIFLRQCILHEGLPFVVGRPRYRKEVENAMAEARRISRDPSVKGYDSIDDLLTELDGD